jgi:hypothetical protein
VDHLRVSLKSSTSGGADALDSVILVQKLLVGAVGVGLIVRVFFIWSTINLRLSSSFDKFVLNIKDGTVQSRLKLIVELGSI